MNEVVTGTETSSSELQTRRDKVLGWIPNPQTPMNHFYNEVHKSFFVENVSFLAVSKKKFSEEFHKETRGQYTVRRYAKKKTPPQLASYWGRTTHSSPMIPALQQRTQTEQVENFVQEIEGKVKSDLHSSILANGRM